MEKEAVKNSRLARERELAAIRDLENKQKQLEEMQAVSGNHTHSYTCVCRETSRSLNAACVCMYVCMYVCIRACVYRSKQCVNDIEAWQRSKNNSGD